MVKGKGSKKRKKSHFQKGHKISPWSFQAETGHACDLNSGPFTPYQTNLEHSPPTTRSKSAENEKYEKENFIANIGKLESLCNLAFPQHIKSSPNCCGVLSLKNHDQRVISSTWKFTCNLCSYISIPVKMYEEVEDKGKRGRKSSTLNIAMGMALVKSSIGINGFQEIMLTLGIDPGSPRGAQKCVNQASVLIELLAEENMRQERQKLSRHRSVSAEGDTRYNNPIGNPNTPMQYASQAVFSMFENMTREKKVIAVQTASKLCLQGTRLIRQQKKPLCPNHPGCTATISQTQSIGMENLYAEDAAKVLKKDGVKLKTITTDGDSKIVNGIRKVYGSSVESLKDAIHYTKAHEKSIAKSKLSNAMFLGQKLRDERSKNYLQRI